jgi:hypothetical protein
VKVPTTSSGECNGTAWSQEHRLQHQLDLHIIFAVSHVVDLVGRSIMAVDGVKA